MPDTLRATKKIDIVVNPEQGARDAWGIWAAKERSLAIELERTPLNAESERDRITAEIAHAQEQQKVLLGKVRSGIRQLTLRALSRGEYRNLLKNHGPRPDEDLDKEYGYNVDTFAAALLRKATIKAQTLDGESAPLDVDQWVDDETGVDVAEFESWFRSALSLNQPGGTQFPPLRVS